MPHFRKLHIKTLNSLDFDALPDDFARLTWTLLPLISCKEGRGMMHLSWLRSQIFPLRNDVTDEMISHAMQSFIALDMVMIYSVQSRDYYQIVKWHEYQNTTREANSPYPENDTNSGATQELVLTSSGEGKAIPSRTSSISTSISTSSSNSKEEDIGSDYAEMLKMWGESFPDKAQPRANNKTLQQKLKTRMKSKHFEENWRDALTNASQSQFLHTSSFFDLGWFLKNDDNYEKCLNGNYSDKQTGQPKKPKTEHLGGVW